MFSSTTRAVVALVAGLVAVGACAANDGATASGAASGSGSQARHPEAVRRLVEAAEPARAGVEYRDGAAPPTAIGGGEDRAPSIAVPGAIVPGGPAVAVTLAPGAPRARFRFSATAGTGYGLALTGVSYAPSPGNVTAILRTGEGAALTRCSFGPSSSCNLDPSMFAATAAYVLDFESDGVAVTSFTAVLTADASGTLAIDGDAAVASLRAGQNARYQFRGTAGQLVTVVISGNTLDDGNPDTTHDTNVLVFPPSGPGASPIGSLVMATVTSALTLDLTLPETGDYTIWIDPVALDRGSVHVAVTSYAQGPLPVDRVATVELGLGQNARYNFTATAGIGYAIAITRLRFTPAAGQLQVRLLRADGTLVASCGFFAPMSCNIDPGAVPTTGTYFVEFDPTEVTATSLGAVLSTEVTGTIAIGGKARITTTLPGQNARYRFDGTAGRTVNVVLSNDSIDDDDLGNGNGTGVVVLQPDGSAIARATIQIPRPGEDPALHVRTIAVTLPETGTYTILIDPQGLDRGSVTLALR